MAHHDKPGITITRVIDAPREVVWKYWTDPDYAKRWWGPKDFTAPHVSIDLRVGGRYLNSMQAPDGKKYWSTGIFEEIVPPEKLVMTGSFADESGNVMPAFYYDMEGDFPLSLQITVTLEGEGGKTKMTLRHAGFSEGAGKRLAEQGWNESFDKIDAGLLRLAA